MKESFKKIGWGIVIFCLFLFGGSSYSAAFQLQETIVDTGNLLIGDFPIITIPNIPMVVAVTNDNKDDYFPSLNNGYAFWYKDGDGIYMWETDKDVSTAHNVVDQYNIFFPSFFGQNSLESLSSFEDKVVFGTQNVFHWFGSEETRNYVKLWNGTSVSKVAKGTAPSIYGDNIAWVRYDGHDSEIVIKKGSDTVQVTDNSRDDIQPSVFGDTVSWAGYDGHDYEIFYWDGDSTYRITNTGNHDKQPSLYDGKIAWAGFDGHDYEIYYWNGNQIVQITNNSGPDIEPSLYNGKIAWAGYDGHDYEIYYWDGTKITQVTSNEYDDRNPSLFNGEILWRSFDGDDFEILYVAIDIPQKPTASTLAVSNRTQTSATLRGYVNPNGQATTYYFEWGTSTSYGHETPHRDAGSSKATIGVDELIANLTPGTTYHYRIVATNPSGTSQGSDKSFTTKAVSVTPPTASTGSAADITYSSAVLTGTLNPKGADTRFRFEYGTNSTYGMATPWFAAGNGNSDINVNATVDDLSPSTTYHFRLVAQNDGGNVTGEDHTFITTEAPDPMQDTRKRFTGWWYDATAPGTGMAIEIQDSNKLFLAWFVYDKNGNTTWYASGGSLANPTTYVGQLYKFTGWAWGSESYSTPTNQVVGSITLVFNKGSNDIVNFTATVDGKIVSSSFSSFMKDFAPGNKDSRDLTGWWYDPAYDGMGFYLDARGGKMAMVWYNYREDHSPRWWTSTAPFADGASTYTGSLDGWKNGQCIGCPYTAPPAITPGEGGTITINFTDATHATATVGSTTINLQRFVIP